MSAAHRHSAMNAGHRQSGFTLLELLVALVLLGFIISGLAAGTELGLRSVAGQARLLAVHQDLQPVDRLLRQLVQDMALPASPQQLALAGTAAGFACVTKLPAADGAEIVDASLSTDAAHRLLLRWSPHLHAERFAPRPPPREEVLLQGVDHIEVSYLSPDRTGWQPGWDRTGLPPLIRLRLVFTAGDSRHWPPIVSATARQSRRRDWQGG